MAQLAKRITQTAPPMVAEMLEKARHLEDERVPLIYLLRGEPNFDTPAHICRAAGDAIMAGYTHYSPTQGLPELRRSIAKRMQRDFQFYVDAEHEIIVTSGATMGVYTALQAIVDPGDEVILFDPIYDPYETAVRLAGGVPRRVSSSYDDGHFAFDRAPLERALNRRTKVILINNPWNPTGSVLSKAELTYLVDLSEMHDLFLVADEIYEKIVFDYSVHTCLMALSPQARARTIIVNSFSKTYAMTGWRLGYNIAPPEVTSAMLRVAQQYSRSAGSFVQMAGVAALDGPEEAITHMVDAYARRSRLVTTTLSELGVPIHPPEGTFFYFLDIRPFGMDSQSMADYLLNKARVVTIPGNVYGPAGEGFVRLSFAYGSEQLEEGLARIVLSLHSL